MKNLPGIIAILAAIAGFMPAKETPHAAPVTTELPNATAAEPVAVLDDPVPTSQAAVVSYDLTSPLEAENESLRAERDELLAENAALKEQVKRLTSYTMQPAKPAPQPVRYTQPVRRLFGR